MTASQALRPTDDTCLVCTLERALDQYGCDGTLRRTEQWCHQRRQSTGWVRRWLQRRGGYCDCEVLMNVFSDATTTLRGLPLRCELVRELMDRERDAEDEDEDEDDIWPW